MDCHADVELRCGKGFTAYSNRVAVLGTAVGMDEIMPKVD